jgi:hypothetical protein
MSWIEDTLQKQLSRLAKNLLGSSNQNTGLQPIDRKSMQENVRVQDYGDRPNIFSNGRVVPSFLIDTNKSYLENVYTLNTVGQGGRNGIPVPPNAGFKPEKYNPDDGNYYIKGNGTVYNKQTGTREFNSGFRGDIREMRDRLDLSTGANGNEVQTSEELGQKLKNVYDPIPSPDDPPPTTTNPSINTRVESTSNFKNLEDRRGDNAYSKNIFTNVKHNGSSWGDYPKESSMGHQTDYIGYDTPSSSASPRHNLKERGKAQEQLRQFNEEYGSVMDSITSQSYTPGVYQDIKQKEEIDKIVKQSGSINNQERTTEFLKDRQYEQKYERNTESVNHSSTMKKLPKYGNTKKGIGSWRYDKSASDRIDKFNALKVLTSNPDNKKAIEKGDFVPLYFEDLVNKKYIPFRAYISGLSDQTTAEWNSLRYLGRADEVSTYGGFARTGSVEFTVYALSIEELHPMWQRINYLFGLTKPAGYTQGGSNSSDSFIIPPMVKFNLGDIYKNQPVLITDVQINIPTEGQWELTNNEYTGNKGKYQYLNETIERGFNGDEKLKVAQYPTQAELSVSMKFLEKRLPQTKNRQFGDWDTEMPIGHNSVNPETYGETDTGEFNKYLNEYSDANAPQG